MDVPYRMMDVDGISVVHENVMEVGVGSLS
jgi:hypothetical protein